MIELLGFAVLGYLLWKHHRDHKRQGEKDLAAHIANEDKLRAARKAKP